MTLGDLFDMIAGNPSLALFYLMAVPLTAFLAFIFGKGQGKETPWRELYAALVYLICIPGIFAITLNVYFFLFERQSIMEANIFTQVLPIISMLITLWAIRLNTCWEDIPGFGRLGGLVTLIFILFTIMWILEKTHIFVISIMPFYYFIILLLILLVASRFAVKSMISK